MARLKSWRYLTILGYPVLKWKVYTSLVCFLILNCVLGGVAYRVISESRGAVVLDPVEAPSETEAKAARMINYVALSPLERLLEDHIRVTQLDEVSDFIAVGTFGGNAEQEVVLKARAPSSYKMRTTYPALGIIIESGYDGSQLWLKENGTQYSEQIHADMLFVKIGMMEASLLHLPWSYRSLTAQVKGLDAVLELMPSEVWRGRECAVVRSYGLLPITMYHYIDRQTYRELHRRAQLTDNEGALLEVGIDFDSLDASASDTLPMAYQILVDGKPHDWVKYGRIEFNQSIFSSVFSRPADSILIDLDIP